MERKKRTISGKILDCWINICERRKRKFFSSRIETELAGLYPGASTKMAIRKFYLEKISVGLKVLSAGGVIVLVCVVNFWLNGDLEQGKYLEKEMTGGGKRTVILDAVIGKETVEDVLIEVEEKELSDDEIQNLLKEAAEKLPEVILGDNANLNYVNQPLNLISSWEDTEVSIFWSSSNYGILQEDGSIGAEEISEEGEEVILTAVLSYEGIQKEQMLTVKVFSPEQTEQEKLRKKLLASIDQTKENAKTEKYLELPVVLDDTEILWKEPAMDKVIGVIGLLIIAIVAVFIGKNQEVHKQYEKRNRQLLLEYSEFVSKLQLLIGSGMSVRSSFIRLGLDYKKRKENGGDRKYVYEELLVAIRKMENGMSETEAYDYFSKRCKLICYKKLVALILQNLKKGTDGLKESLLAETKNAFEERKQLARKSGEEAGTKLLLPMMMMMGIVLMIIVIPAYFSFGGI